MSSDFPNLLDRLVKAGFDFVIIGGYAGIVHGCTYVTQDIDLCCDFSPSNLLALQGAVSDLHPVHRVTPGRKKFELTEKTAATFKNLYLDTDLGQLDCVSFVQGIGEFEKVKQASAIVTVGCIELRVLGLDALIKAKKAMNRPHDRQAVLQLEAIKKLKDNSSKR